MKSQLLFQKMKPILEFIFRGLPAREPKPVVCNDERQDDLFHSAGPTQEPVLSTPNTRRNYVQLVSWCFEPSQLLGVTSGLSTNSNLSLSFFLHTSHSTSTTINSVQNLEKKNEVEWTGEVEIRKREVEGNGRSMRGFIMTDFSQVLKGEPLKAPGFSPEGTLTSASTVSHCGRSHWVSRGLVHT